MSGTKPLSETQTSTLVSAVSQIHGLINIETRVSPAKPGLREIDWTTAQAAFLFRKMDKRGNSAPVLRVSPEFESLLVPGKF